MGGLALALGMKGVQFASVPIYINTQITIMPNKKKKKLIRPQIGTHHWSDAAPINPDGYRANFSEDMTEEERQAYNETIPSTWWSFSKGYC